MKIEPGTLCIFLGGGKGFPADESCRTVEVIEPLGWFAHGEEVYRLGPPHNIVATANGDDFVWLCKVETPMRIEVDTGCGGVKDHWIFKFPAAQRKLIPLGRPHAQLTHTREEETPS